MQAAEILPAFLAAGVTSLGDTDSLREDIAILHETGTWPNAARSFASGPCLTAVGGYPAPRDPAGAVEIDGPESARAAVDEMANLGVDYIKIAQEPFNWNFQDPGYLPFLSAEDIATTIERAHAHGLRVRSHLRYGHNLIMPLMVALIAWNICFFPLPMTPVLKRSTKLGNSTLPPCPNLRNGSRGW